MTQRGQFRMAFDTLGQLCHSRRNIPSVLHAMSVAT